MAVAQIRTIVRGGIECAVERNAGEREANHPTGRQLAATEAPGDTGISEFGASAVIESESVS